MSSKTKKIIITVLMVIVEISGSIICFSNLFVDPFVIILFWSICTLCAFEIWNLITETIDND